MPPTLAGKTAAILVADHYQVHEAFYPYYRLKEEGVATFFVGEEANRIYHDYHDEPLACDLSITDAVRRDWDFIHCPGGFAPMTLRANPLMLELAHRHITAGRLFGAICHAGSFLVALDVLEGRKATCFYTLKDDLINAGADYVDEAPVVDGNLVTARTPEDLPSFMEAVVQLLYGTNETDTGIQSGTFLKGMRVGLVVGPRYQLHQVWYPYFRFLSVGADVVRIGTQSGAMCKSRISRLDAKCELSADQALGRTLAVLLVSGDWTADLLRTKKSILQLVRQHVDNGKLLVSIGEGHSILISAGVLTGVKVAGLPGMAKDIQNSGATYLDQPVVTDHDLITARDTPDLPELIREVIVYLQSGRLP